MQKAILNDGRDPVRRRTYITWKNMLKRCNDPENDNYQYYGGKGIKVCARWLNFEAFVEDMGWRPENMTLDRRSSKKNYTKSNCRWATKKQQANNTSNNRRLTYKGKTRNLIYWARKFGLPESTIASRLRRGWMVSAALTTPTRSNAIRNYTYKGKTQSIEHWARELGVTSIRLRYRLGKGLTFAQAIKDLA
jgi:hypothetical protein